MRAKILFIAFAGLVHQANAQSTAEFNQQLGVCSAQTDKTKRSMCFERLAKDAVAEMDRQRLVLATQPSPPQIQAKPQVSKYSDFVAKAKANITSGFKDPNGVQWRNLFIGSDRPALCGELNGKNAYGAYTGFKRFVSTPDPAQQTIDNEEFAAVFEFMWKVYCKRPIETVE